MCSVLCDLSSADHRSQITHVSGFAYPRRLGPKAQIPNNQQITPDTTSLPPNKRCQISAAHYVYNVNKTLARRKNLPDTTRDNFDLSDIEDKLTQNLDILGNGEPVSILRRTAFVHAATRKTAQKVHDLDDFRLIEASHILKMVEATREQYP